MGGLWRAVRTWAGRCRPEREGERGQRSGLAPPLDSRLPTLIQRQARRRRRTPLPGVPVASPHAGPIRSDVAVEEGSGGCAGAHTHPESGTPSAA